MESAVTLLSRTAPARAAIVVAGLVVGSIIGFVALATTPAAAEGLFDFLFGGARRSAPPSSVSSYSDPNGGQASQRPAEPALETGPSVAFCVRLCDGRYFPIQRT